MLCSAAMMATEGSTAVRFKRSSVELAHLGSDGPAHPAHRNERSSEHAWDGAGQKHAEPWKANV